MILPGLAPHHTRASFGSKSRLYVEKYARTPDDFVLSGRGLWLLPAAVAERDRAAGEKTLADVAQVQTEKSMTTDAQRNRAATEVLRRTTITETGCMVGGIRSNSQKSPAQWAVYFAGAELGTVVLDEPDDLEYLRVCDTDGCYNTRHYDLDYASVAVPRRVTELNPDWYNVSDGGEVSTVWGDDLGTIEDSLKLFKRMQRLGYPFVPYEESKITPSGTSYVQFHPLTGCWEAWTYHVRPDGAAGGRFEGYGTIYSKYERQRVDRETGEVIGVKRRGGWLAHRTMWRRMGNYLDTNLVLNHLCNYKRCCNPQHLEQITEEENKEHGRIANIEIRRVAQEHERVGAHWLSAAELARLGEPILAIY